MLASVSATSDAVRLQPRNSSQMPNRGGTRRSPRSRNANSSGNVTSGQMKYAPPSAHQSGSATNRAYSGHAAREQLARPWRSRRPADHA